MGMERKTVIVTGGANVIGKAVSAMFAKQGANVAIVDRDVKKGEAFAKINEYGERLCSKGGRQ